MLPTDDYPSANIGAASSRCVSENYLKAQRSTWFWNQAREARSQGEATVRHPNFVTRTVEHGKERCVRGKIFAAQDDVRLGLSPPNSASPKAIPPPLAAATPAPKSTTPSTPPAPSVALVGLSLIGDLDKVYKAHEYPSLQLLHSTSGTRKGPGALLIFSHTFAERLYVHVGWDREGFEPGLVEDFADGIVGCIREFALNSNTKDDSLHKQISARL